MSALNPLDVLKKYWKYDGFRNLQEEIITSVLDGKDTLALLPTGGGKSICYQVPALCLPGVCLVISPLIALMQDQVMRLNSLGIESACIHSGLHWKQIDNIISNARYGTLKILYISPERLSSAGFTDQIRDINLSFVAVDEAHCIAQWGYDFRPSYLKISEIRNFTNKPFLALTATATPYAKSEIIKHLRMSSPVLFEMSFRREQLSFIVREDEQKNETLLHLLKKQTESIIIYLRNRRLTVELSEMLQSHKISANCYHAGLQYSERMLRQQNWLENKAQVMVATNAFGMGIDKPDVRMVIHLDLPQGIEEYYQEAGRAGRDQQRSYAVMLYHRQDVNRLIQQWEDMFPDISEIKDCYKYLSIHLDIAVGSEMVQSMSFDLAEFSQRFGLPVNKTLHALKILEQCRYIEMGDAVLSPSKVQIIASIPELDEYREKDVLLNELIQALLRTYEGIFSAPVSIQENSLARICSVDYSKIIKALKYLHNENLIQFQEAKDKPQIRILNLRMNSNEIQIDKEWYTRRKDTLRGRLENMIAFLDSKECRQKFITRYFGQILKEDCGICDNCIKNKTGRIDNETKRQWKEKMIQLFKSNSVWLYRDLIREFPFNKQEWAEEIIREMIHENEIVRQHEKLKLNSEKLKQTE